nr:transposon Ty3-G Gag-Pol polyprotein [Tanacetum cinerariifolium]
MAELQKLTTNHDQQMVGPSGFASGGIKPYLKLHFPRFGWEDPKGWLYQAKQYFEFQRVETEDQVQLASFHLDGIALQWHRWITKFRGPMTWAEFSKAILGRFGPTEYEDPVEALSRLKQTTTVASYQEAFEKISHQVDVLPEIFLVGCFIGGLKEEIRLEVKLKTPKNLTQAIGMALLVEEKLNFQRRGYTSQRLSALSAPSRSTTTQGILGPEVEDEETLGDTLEQNPDASHAEISFHAISGSINPQTLRLPGKIKNKEVVVLIDDGSTHNFIDQALADCFGLVVEMDTLWKVVVGNREHVTCTGRVNYLGHVISFDGVKVEPDKIQVVSSWPTPTNAKGVRGFLGLAGYYSKFIKGFGGIAAPLHRLVGKAHFQWVEFANNAFQGLKEALTTTPTLGLPNWSLPFTLECDVSGVGIGAVLTQNRRTLTYFSSPLKGTVLSWSTYEKEMLAVVKAVCQRFKTDNMKHAGLLQPLLIPEKVWEDVSMDFVEGLPNLKGFTAVMVVVDRLSKYAHFVPLRHPFTATTIAREFVSNIVRLHGIPSTVVSGTTNVQAVDEYLRDRDELLKQLRANLLAAQHGMKIQADHHRLELEFEKGDLVFVKLQPYRQTLVATRVSNKLSPWFFGAYQILDKVGPVAYRVELPSGSLIHDVFHVSLLRRCVGSTTEPSQATIDASVLPSSPLQPECILDEGVVLKGKYRPKTKLLVKWLGRSLEDATWETK